MQPTLIREDMHYWLLTPALKLQPWVACYFVVRPSPGFPQGTNKPELFLPDGMSELVFAMRAGFERWKVGDSSKPAVMSESYVIGGRAHSVMTQSAVPNEVIGVKLHSRLLSSLIRTPLSTFRDVALSLRDLDNHLLLQLEDELAGLRHVEAITRALDRFFANAIRNLHPDALVDAFTREVQTARGSVSVLRWIEERGVNARTFERKFCDAMGMVPKQYARVMRFRHAYRDLISEPDAHGARYLDTYYDQSHFHRDFKYFTGVSPRIKSRGLFQQETSISDQLLQHTPGATTASP